MGKEEFTTEDHKAFRKAMNKYGINPEDTVWVFSSWRTYRRLKIAATQATMGAYWRHRQRRKHHAT